MTPRSPPWKNDARTVIPEGEETGDASATVPSQAGRNDRNGDEGPRTGDAPRLTASRELAKVLKDRATMAQESYSQAMDSAMDEVLTSDLPPMERTGRLTMLRSQAANAAIEQAVEFAPEN